MALFLIERQFAERLEVTPDGVREVDEINADEGVFWVFSFLSSDQLRSYCVYEASSPAAILAAARRAGLPADAIVEVDKIDPAAYRAAAPQG